MDDKRTRKQELAYREMRRAVIEARGMVLELEMQEQERRYIASLPRGWRTLEEDVPTRPRKTRITLAVDTDVVKYYRAMGNGYQARMNATLRAYMLSRFAGIMKGRDEKWID